MAFRSDSTGTYTFPSGSSGSTVDLGARNNIRYVNAENVKSTHTGTYTLTWNSDFGKTKDMGTTHTYRYISVPSIPDLKLYFITNGANYGAFIKADFLNIYKYITTESGGLFDNYTTYPGGGWIGRNSLTGGTKYTISNLLTDATGCVELSSGIFTLSNS